MLDEQLPAIKSATRDPAWLKRRQPRRHFYPMSDLFRLPRPDGESSHHQLIDDHDDQEPNHLKPFTGVMVAVGLSVPIWLTIIGLLYYLI